MSLSMEVGETHALTIAGTDGTSTIAIPQTRVITVLSSNSDVCYVSYGNTQWPPDDSTS